MDPYVEGWDANDDGVPRRRNPYVRRGLAAAWDGGWLACERTYRGQEVDDAILTAIGREIKHEIKHEIEHEIEHERK